MNREVELIECVKKYHVIWNPNVARNPNKIKGAWSAVAEILHLEESICRKKWSKLRYGFNCFTKNIKGSTFQRTRVCKNAQLYKSMDFLLLRNDAVAATVDQKCSNKQKQNRSLLKEKGVDENHSVRMDLKDNEQTNLERWNETPLKVITLPANVWPKVFDNKTGIKNGLVSPRKASIELATSNKPKPLDYSVFKYHQTEKVKNTLKYANSADAVQNFFHGTSKISLKTDQNISYTSLRDVRILSEATQDEISPLLSPWPLRNASYTWQSPLDTIIIKSEAVQHNKDEYLRYAIKAAYGLPCKRMTLENGQFAEANQGTQYQKYIQGEVESYFR